MSLTAKERRELNRLLKIQEQNPEYFQHRINQLQEKDQQDAGCEEEVTDEEVNAEEENPAEEKETQPKTRKTKARRIHGGQRISVPRSDR